MKHPNWNQWMEWTAGEGDPETRARMEDHLRTCPACTRDVETLRRLRAAGAVGPLATPPDHLLDDILRATREQPAPLPATDGEEVAWELADIRGAEAKAAGETLYLARSLPGYQLSLMVEPPGPDRMWTIEGRLWPEADGGRAEVRLVLLRGDHVLVDRTEPVGRSFRLREIAEAGWTLELHVGDRTFVIDDPFV